MSESRDETELGNSTELVSLNYATLRRESIYIPDKNEGGINWFFAAFFLVNASLGAGMLNFPLAYDKSGGIYFASFLQLVVVVVMFSTTLVLIYCSDLTHTDTYHEVIFSMCGRVAQLSAAVSILLTCYGVCIAFLVVIGDQYGRLFLSLYGKHFCLHWYLNRKFTISATAVIAILPMCYCRKLDFLKYPSALGFLAMIYTVGLTVYEYWESKAKPGRIKTVPNSVVELFAIIPVFSFAYQTHEIVVPLYACMKERTIIAYIKSSILTLCVLFTIYCVVGSFGYLTFGSNAPPDIMDLYDANDPVVLVALGALILKMVSTYPQLMHCGRSTLEGLYVEFFHITKEQFNFGELKRRIIITSFWFATTLLISIFTPNMEIVIQLLGCLASFNVYVFPGLCMMSLGFKENEDLTNCRRKTLIGVACVIITFGGFIFGVEFTNVVITNLPGSRQNIPIDKC